MPIGFNLTDADDTTVDHLQAATSWADVGAWVENFDPTQAGSSEKFKPDTSTGDNGWREDHSISLYTPEALAWFAYKVNTAPCLLYTSRCV